MKRSLIALFCTAIAGPLSAQPNFKLTCSTTPNREYTEWTTSGTNQYMVNQTVRNEQYRDRGTITLFSAEHKKLASFSYQNPPKKYSNLTYPLIAKDKLLLFTGSGGIVARRHTSRYILTAECGLATIQEYSLPDLKATGEKKSIFSGDSKYSSAHIARSPDGKTFVVIQTTTPYSPAVKVILYRNAEPVYSKEITLKNVVRGPYTVVNTNSIVVSNGGEVAFTYGEVMTSVPYTCIAAISANGEKILDKELKAAGKTVPGDANFLFEDDGSLVVAATYGVTGKKVENFTGVVVEKFSPTLELVKHTELPFSAETIAKCAESTTKQKGTLYYQVVNNILPVNDGYVIVTQQVVELMPSSLWYSATTNLIFKTMYNNLVCFGLSKDCKENYQSVVRTIPQKSTFVIFEQMGSYVSNNRVYIFHSGNDDKVKNTPNEFDLYCTTWEGATTTPQMKTVLVPRPFADLHIYPEVYNVLAPNKLLFYARGNGGDIMTTMEITE